MVGARSGCADPLLAVRGRSGRGAPHAASHGAKHGHAATAAAPAKQSFLGGNAEMFLAAGVVAVVALLVMPLPPFLLDALLALSFALSIVILLVTMSTRDPLEFSIFPSLLLLVTLDCPQPQARETGASSGSSHHNPTGRAHAAGAAAVPTADDRPRTLRRALPRRGGADRHRVVFRGGA